MGYKGLNNVKIVLEFIEILGNEYSRKEPESTWYQVQYESVTLTVY
jgi:hypothetical protein